MMFHERLRTQPTPATVTLQLLKVAHKLNISAVGGALEVVPGVLKPFFSVLHYTYHTRIYSADVLT